MDQRLTIEKHGGGIMILVIVFTESAPLSAGDNFQPHMLKRGIRNTRYTSYMQCIFIKKEKIRLFFNGLIFFNLVL